MELENKINKLIKDLAKSLGQLKEQDEKNIEIWKSAFKSLGCEIVDFYESSKIEDLVFIVLCPNKFSGKSSILFYNNNFAYTTMGHVVQNTWSGMYDYVAMYIQRQSSNIPKFEKKKI